MIPKIELLDSKKYNDTEPELWVHVEIDGVEYSGILTERGQ